jgi:exoribonuclease R
MKNNRTKKALSKFSGRNVHKRKSKERAKAELLRAVADTGVSTDALKLNIAVDNGRRGRISAKRGKDEINLRGVFSSSKSGFGFVTPLEGEYERDIFIPEDKTSGAIDGDLVDIVFHSYTSRFGEEKTEGRVTKIVEYGRKTIIGTVIRENYAYRSRRKKLPGYVLLPDDAHIPLRPAITDLADAEEGDKVEALLIRGVSPLNAR